MTQPAGEVTRLLIAARDGDAGANAQLMAALHAELSRMARHYMRQERRDHTLQATALVNEAYIRLLGKEAATWQNRAHFLAHAARAMRQILVDHARAHRSDKRGGKQVKISIDDSHGGLDQPLADALAAPTPAAEILALHEALEELSQLDPRQAQVVELRYFGGCQEAEIAKLLGLNERTIRRDCKTAQLWLRHRMQTT